ncbi:FAD-dependent oxidoreductase [Mycobacterium helveticum]|uniref:FAD-dependent oxidoreductase n=2 Tax=Mycobacterium helveticum TaxID=2592811 RepID=A0A557XMR1_9MYCO|nr:FAD-dependent oxidoreductase [Mycobacterium helveticum]TVS87121.1 FAD-dependent oxidoreductase [Mycobacterium helveticum]
MAQPISVTVVGGGLAGLTAAIACAERGAVVTVHEAHSALGGRAKSSPAPYVANDGTHAFYQGEPWRWLVARDLTGTVERLGIRQLAGVRMRHRGQLRRLPPRALTAMVCFGRRRQAPVDRSFREWASVEFGDQAFAAAAGLLGPALYDADPGRLSAAFAFERLLRVTTPSYPPATRYPPGGWGAVVSQMAAHARGLGVVVETNSRITALPEDGPVIVATSLPAARNLLDDNSLQWESGNAALLDIGVHQHRSDPFAVFDLDEGGFVERFTSQDPSLAPALHSLIQGEIPIRPDETKASGIARLEALFDVSFPDWRGRVTWRRQQNAQHRTGALDLPGTTWRDRPKISRGDHRYLIGDMVAAPGLLAEVSINSALIASAAATHPRPDRSTSHRTT